MLVTQRQDLLNSGLMIPARDVAGNVFYISLRRPLEVEECEDDSVFKGRINGNLFYFDSIDLDFI